MTTGNVEDKNQRALLLALNLDPEADSEEAERLGQQLRREIAELDVDGVAPAFAGSPPEGAKGGSVDWVTLLVTFGASGGVFTAVIALARDWFSRHIAAQKIQITMDGDTIILDRSSSREREQLIDAWLRRHSGDQE